MRAEPDPDATHDFLSMALSQSLLTPQAAEQVEREATARGVAVSQVALERGMLDAVQVDTVETFLRPGEAIPGYEIQRVLGRGGMGIVYQARQTNLDRTVAIKTILVSQLSQTVTVARFEKEAVTVAKLQHPNIVTAYDFGRHGGRLFFVMEYLEGETLEQRLQRQGRLDEATTWGLVRQTAAGLAHAHAMGIVHRDIKPSNLFLVDPPAGVPLPSGMMVKITDFGLVLETGRENVRLTTTGSALGTPIYMAPEQAKQADIDFRADLYALGATAYHMLTGRPPFISESALQILLDKTKQELPDLGPLHAARASAETISLLSSLVARDREARLGSYQELLDRIDRLPLAPALCPAPTVRLLAVEAPKRRRIRPWQAAVILLPLVAIFAALLAKWTRPEPNVPQVRTETWTRQLFDGKSVSPPHWMTLNGQWAPAKDAEGGIVLSGRGVIVHHLPLLADYRLSLGVDLQQAAAVELHFGIQDGDNGARNVLRVTREGAVLGRRLGEKGPLETLSPVLPYPDAGDGSPYRELRVERQGKRWWASFNGERLGEAPADRDEELPEFRLVVEKAAALFDVLEVAELGK